jgi:hypothetical protein
MGSMKKYAIGILTAILWLGSVGLGMAAIPTVRDLLLTLYAWIVSGFGRYPNRVENAENAAWALSQGVILLLAIILLAYAVGSGEYLSRHLGQRGTWKLLGWAFAVEAIILLLAYFF